jgi:hypothetical protein
MRANTDRAPGVTLVTDAVGRRVASPTPPAPPAGEPFDFGPHEPEGLKAWAGRISDGFAVQGLVDAAGRTYVTCVLNGETETIEFEPGQALDAYLHPFAYGFTLPL